MAHEEIWWEGYQLSDADSGINPLEVKKACRKILKERLMGDLFPYKVFKILSFNEDRVLERMGCSNKQAEKVTRFRRSPNKGKIENADDDWFRHVYERLDVILTGKNGDGENVLNTDRTISYEEVLANDNKMSAPSSSDRGKKNAIKNISEEAALQVKKKFTEICCWSDAADLDGSGVVFSKTQLNDFSNPSFLNNGGITNGWRITEAAKRFESEKEELGYYKALERYSAVVYECFSENHSIKLYLSELLDAPEKELNEKSKISDVYRETDIRMKKIFAYHFLKNNKDRGASRDFLLDKKIPEYSKSELLGPIFDNRIFFEIKRFLPDGFDRNQVMASNGLEFKNSLISLHEALYHWMVIHDVLEESRPRILRNPSIQISGEKSEPGYPEEHVPEVSLSEYEEEKIPRSEVNETIDAFIDAGATYSRFLIEKETLRYAPGLTKKLCDPDFLTAIKATAKEREICGKILVLANSKDPETYGYYINLHRICTKSIPFREEMVKELSKPLMEGVDENSSLSDLYKRATQELRKDYCYYILNEKLPKRLLDTKLDLDPYTLSFKKKAPKVSDFFSNPDLLKKLGLSEEIFSKNRLYGLLKVRDRIHDIETGRTRPDVAKNRPENIRGNTSVRPVQTKEEPIDLENISKKIKETDKQRRDWVASGLKGESAPIYSGGLLCKVFNENTFRILGIDCFRGKMEKEELVRKVEFEIKMGQPGNYLAEAWRRRTNNPEKLEEIQKNGNLFGNLNSLMTKYILPLIEKQMEQKKTNVLNQVAAEAPGKLAAPSWKAGQAVDRKATEERIAARSLTPERRF